MSNLQMIEIMDTQMTPPEVIKVAIIEDRREIREGLSMLIGGTEGYACTGSYRSMEEALDKISRELPDVVLSDIGLPGMDGIEGIKHLKARHPDLLILMLSVYDDDDRIFEALCAGACGYLLKKTPPVRLIESLKEAVMGGSPMSPEVARRVITLLVLVPAPFSFQSGIRIPKSASVKLPMYVVTARSIFANLSGVADRRVRQATKIESGIQQ